MKSLAESWTVDRVSNKGHRKSATGAALFGVRIGPLEGVITTSCYTFILTEVIDVNSLFGVITYKRMRI